MAVGPGIDHTTRGLSHVSANLVRRGDGCIDSSGGDGCWGEGRIERAVTKLADSPNYSWTTKVEGGFSAGAGGGRTEKDGPTSLAILFGDETYQVIINRDKAAAKGSGGWASLAELERDAEEDGNGFSVERILSVTIQNFKTPAALAKDLCDELDDVQKSGEAFTADLKPETTKKLLSGLRRRAATAKGAPIDVTEPKGSVSFWIRDGSPGEDGNPSSGRRHFQRQGTQN